MERIFRSSVITSVAEAEVTCPAASSLVLKGSWDKNKIGFVEQSKVLLLNRPNRELGVYEFSRAVGGGLHGKP